MTDIDKQIESLGYEIRVSDLSCCYIVYENKKQDQEVIIEWEDDDMPVECCKIFSQTITRVKDWLGHTNHSDVYCKYDIPKYKDVTRNRWDPFKNEPISQASQLCYILRRIVNTDESRVIALMEILEKTPRAIIFYNFDYEREMLLHLLSDDEYVGYEIAEWSGHAHQPVPNSERWIYLCQYTAGNSGWNCIKTDTIIFFSQNYSYKVMEQACGRIDRLNTPFKDLYYYHLKSRSGIDLAISKALDKKKKFNERKFTKWN